MPPRRAARPPLARRRHRDTRTGDIDGRACRAVLSISRRWRHFGTPFRHAAR